MIRAKGVELLNRERDGGVLFFWSFHLARNRVVEQGIDLAKAVNCSPKMAAVVNQRVRGSTAKLIDEMLRGNKPHTLFFLVPAQGHTPESGRVDLMHRGKGGHSGSLRETCDAVEGGEK